MMAMTEAHLDHLRTVMNLAWRVFRQRHIPGCNIRTFADALRNAWNWMKRKALPPVPAGPTLHLRSMLQSPMRRATLGQAYSFDRRYRAGRLTSRLGA